MKSIFFFLFLFSISVSSQNFKKTDSIVRHYPNFNSVEKLASKIEADFNTDIEKVRASFFWLATNIKYTQNKNDLISPPEKIFYFTEEDKQYRINQRNDDLVKKTFLSKKGVCEHFALSFKKTCDLLLIKSFLIAGYVRNSPLEIGIYPKEKNHIWNAVKIKNKLLYLDITWAAGYFLNKKWVKSIDNYYFDIDQNNIEKTHLTLHKKDPLQLKQKSIRFFHNQPIYSREFLTNSLTLIQPTSGVIYPNKNKYITLKIKNLSANTEIHYFYDDSITFSKKAKVKHKENIAHIKIRSPKNSTNLFLFFDKKLGLQYKILVD